MRLRVILACTLFLLAAVPTFALPLCAHCDEWNACDSASGDTDRCFYDLSGMCKTDSGRCSIPSAATTVLTDWKVVSIEITRPAQDSFTVNAPAPAADIPTPPAPQKTELR